MYAQLAIIIGLVFWLAGWGMGASSLQTITLTAPTSGVSCVSGDEFATTIVGNPWDMNQLRDIPFDFRFDQPSVQNGIWTGVIRETPGAVYPLFRGYATPSYPYTNQFNVYDNGMPYGTINPIDTTRFTRLAMRMALPKSARSSVWMVWTTNATQVEYFSNGSVGFIDGDYLTDGARDMYADGFRIYDFGFTAQEFFEDKVSEPSPGFNTYGTWSGWVYGFLIHPTLDGPPGTSVSIDWIRLYDPVTSPRLPITWKTTGVPTDDNFLYSVQVWVDTNGSGYDGDLFVTCLKNDGRYDLYTAALPPGTYYYYLKLMRRDFNAWTELARSAYSSAVRVEAPPELEFTAPTYTSGDDFAATELGNAWDMTDSGDIQLFHEVSGPSFLNGILYGSADAPVPPATDSDAVLYLNMKVNGQTAPIDPAIYRYCTYRMAVDPAGYTNINDRISRGWGVRLVWYRQGEGYQTQFSPLLEDWHSYTIDLWDPYILEGYETNPNQLGWKGLDSIDDFRLHPLEVPQATRFALDDVKLCAENKPKNNACTISWVVSDSDSATVAVDLAYGAWVGDKFEATPITTLNQAPGAGSFTWDTTTVRQGRYLIRAIVSDGSNSVTRLSRVPVVIEQEGEGKFSLTNAWPLAADFDGDGKADPALYQDSSGTWEIILTAGDYSLLPLLQFLGAPGDTALAADFDGDGKADPAVYTKQIGTWLILLSGDGYSRLPLANFMGGPGYAALAADFDGDGLADPAVVEGSMGTWEIRLSSSGYESLVLDRFLGGPGDTVLAADFDGDSKADPAIYAEASPSTSSTSSPQAGSPLREGATPGQAGQAGNWTIRLSGSAYQAVEVGAWLGLNGGRVLAADLDGDGKADPILYQESTGGWQIRLSESGYQLFSVVL